MSTMERVRAVLRPGTVTAVAAPPADDFHAMLLALLPKLRVQALALTRNRAAAEDLVQDAVANALAARDSFVPGTNFPAWMHRILRNRFISTLRKQKETVGIEDVSPLMFAASGVQEERGMLRELAAALRRLPDDQRLALLMVVLQGMSYEQVAEATGVAVGTAKSRVFRGRQNLQAMLEGRLAAPGRSKHGASGDVDPAHRAAVMGVLHRDPNGWVSRATISKATGIAAEHVSIVLRRLAAEGVVETGRSQGRSYRIACGGGPVSSAVEAERAVERTLRELPPGRWLRSSEVARRAGLQPGVAIYALRALAEREVVQGSRGSGYRVVPRADA